MAIVNTTRGLIIHDGKLLVFKHRPEDGYFCLPGGRLEEGETIEDGLIRELTEETGIRPVLGKLLIVNQLIIPENKRHRIEFFFHIKNSADYLDLDLSKATHGFEVCEHEFVATDDKCVLFPDFLKDVLREINDSGLEQFETRMLTSN